MYDERRYRLLGEMLIAAKHNLGSGVFELTSEAIFEKVERPDKFLNERAATSIA